MPLLRYLTGDRGVWRDEYCGCPLPGRRFELRTARALMSSLRPAGRRITRLDVAKLFTPLDLDVARIIQNESSVTVEYRADRAVGNLQRTAVAAAVRGLLGPGMAVSLRRAGVRPNSP